MESQMDRDEYIDEVMVRIRKMMVDVYDHGVTAEAARNEHLRQSLAALIGVSTELPSNAGKRAKAPAPRKSGVARTRAPKGAVGEAVAGVFQDGMTTKEVEYYAALKNPAINGKSVYNELWRQKEVYRQDNGRWYRIAEQHAPAADGRPNGFSSAAGLEARHGGESRARAPAAAGEVGGT